MKSGTVFKGIQNGACFRFVKFYKGVAFVVDLKTNRTITYGADAFKHLLIEVQDDT